MGIFDNEIGVYETFQAKIQFRNWLVGGQPKSVKSMREFLMRRMKLTDYSEQLRREMLRLMSETNQDTGDMDVKEMSIDDLEKLADKIAQQTVNGFKSDENGLYIESYQIKAAFRENAMIAFAGSKWGKTKKAAKGYLAERLFIGPDHLSLGKTEPDGIVTKYGTTFKSGAIVTRAEYVEHAALTFEIKISQDALHDELYEKSKAEDGSVVVSQALNSKLKELFIRMQDNGLGAMRSSGYGTFDLVEFVKLPQTTERKKSNGAPKQNGSALEAE